jgi:hypothetical protein
LVQEKAAESAGNYDTSPQTQLMLYWCVSPGQPEAIVLVEVVGRMMLVPREEEV